MSSLTHRRRLCPAIWWLAPFVCSAAASAQPLIAGFTLDRGGISAIDTDAGWLTQLRAAIVAEYASAEFLGLSTLTSGGLQGADVVLLSAAFSGGVPISPLTASERDALRSFVLGGGSAILLVDADSPPGWDAANESLIDAFGFDVTGTLNGTLTVDLTIASSPISAGRFGSPAALQFTTGGRIDLLGPGAQAVGVYAGTAHTAVAYIPKGALGPGSDLVAVFADTMFITDGFLTPPHRAAILNLIGEAYQGACRADFNQSGTTDVPDIFAFLSAWFAGDIARANYNGDAFLNTADLFAFLADWFAGC